MGSIFGDSSFTGFILPALIYLIRVFPKVCSKNIMKKNFDFKELVTEAYIFKKCVDH